MIDSNKDLVADPSLAEAFIKEMRGEKLDGVDRLRILSRAYFSMRNFENMHYQYKTGMLTSDEWRGFKMNLEAICEWPSVRTFWENEKQFFSSAFQKEISEILEKVPDAKASSHRYVIHAGKENSD